MGKKATSLSELFKGLPPEFTEYMQYCRGLGFQQQPDYMRWRNAFKRRMEKLGYLDNGAFDWVKDSVPTPPQPSFLERILSGNSGHKSVKSHSVPADRYSEGGDGEKDK